MLRDTTMTESLTASTTVADVLLRRPLAARILVNHRMHCVGCAIAPFETLEEACEIYGISLRHLLASGAERRDDGESASSNIGEI